MFPSKLKSRWSSPFEVAKVYPHGAVDVKDIKHWALKVDDALWAYRTVFKTPIGTSLYKLLYGKSCHLPFELEHKAFWDIKFLNYNLKTTGEKRMMQLNELDEWRANAYENSRLYKEATKRRHDARSKQLKQFKVGDLVLLYNSRLKLFSGKLKSRWSGPFVIKTIFPYGTIEVTHPTRSTFKRLRIYNGGDFRYMRKELRPREPSFRNENRVTLASDFKRALLRSI
ncbi:Pol polyprotein [Gossypium australe]|uniref:Pol polyprotein n=1 Tax=Gossypium australe TaxID=47621 RepID=A0A5B6ULL5_9ROSI|nr:Pol polyprotein [Gossypium australe]